MLYFLLVLIRICEIAVRFFAVQRTVHQLLCDAENSVQSFQRQFLTLFCRRIAFLGCRVTTSMVSPDKTDGIAAMITACIVVIVASYSLLLMYFCQPPTVPGPILESIAPE